MVPEMKKAIFILTTNCHRKWEIPIHSSPWRGRQQSPPKWWYPTTTLHSITTQKTATQVFRAVKTSDLAEVRLCLYYKDIYFIGLISVPFTV